jgi:cyclase
MLKIRVIPTILTDGYSQVKGEKFNSWRTVGSVITAAKVFARRDVDELVLLDVNARSQNQTIDKSLVATLAEFLRVPFAVGGGINSLDDIEDLLSLGADKIILGTAAVDNPNLIADAAKMFGSQAVVCAVDYRKVDGTYSVACESGTRLVKKSPLHLALFAQNNGAGEILLQNIDMDGTLNGVDVDTVKVLQSEINIPLIASGGVGKLEDFESLFAAGASAVAAGAIFQFTQVTPREVRRYLDDKGYPVRSY